MMTLEQAMAKASKLLRLSESANANEAALAAQRAQEILARYNIDAALLSIDGDGNAQFVPDEPISQHDTLEDGGGRLASWKPRLASCIARVNNCRVYLSGTSIGIVGRKGDSEKVRYLYAFFAVEIDRLTASHGKGMGRSFCASFRIGVVAAISEKLRDAQRKVAEDMRQESVNEYGLVRLNKALERLNERDRAVDQWMRENMNLRSKSSNTRTNSEGHAAGYKAGQSLNMGGSRGGIGTGQKRLGSG